MDVVVLKHGYKFFDSPPMERCGFISSPIESGEFGESDIMWLPRLSHKWPCGFYPVTWNVC